MTMETAMRERPEPVVWDDAVPVTEARARLIDIARSDAHALRRARAIQLLAEKAMDDALLEGEQATLREELERERAQRAEALETVARLSAENTRHAEAEAMLASALAEAEAARDRAEQSRASLEQELRSANEQGTSLRLELDRAEARRAVLEEQFEARDAAWRRADEERIAAIAATVAAIEARVEERHAALREREIVALQSRLAEQDRSLEELRAARHADAAAWNDAREAMEVELARTRAERDAAAAQRDADRALLTRLVGEQSAGQRDVAQPGGRSPNDGGPA